MSDGPIHRKKQVLRNLSLIASGEELIELVRRQTGKKLDSDVAEETVSRALKGSLRDVQDLLDAVGGQAAKMRLIEDALGGIETEKLAEMLGAVEVTGTREAEFYPVIWQVVPSDQGPIEVPEKEPPQPEIPENPTWRLGRVIGARVREWEIGGCKYKQNFRFDVMHGPMQVESEHLFDIVIVEPTGGSVSTGVDVSVAGSGIESPSYEVVRVRVCIVHRWRLEVHRRSYRTVRRCPPAMKPEVVRDEVEEMLKHWVQLDPIFPEPCERTVLFRFGGSFRDPFERAKQAADHYAQRFGLPRGEGILQDSRG